MHRTLFALAAPVPVLPIRKGARARPDVSARVKVPALNHGESVIFGARFNSSNPVSGLNPYPRGGIKRGHAGGAGLLHYQASI